MMTAPLRLLFVVGLASALIPVLSASGLRREPTAGPARFPRSSIVDFSTVLDPPAGKHGFLSVGPDGRFRWSDGRKARFWGVNISNQSLFVGDATIRLVADALARSGTNMVRFEAIDSLGGVLHDSEGRPVPVPDPAKLRTLDIWIDELRSRGIYYYVNLLDLRTFTEADGVPDAASLSRAGRPYAMFDPILLEAQKRFARQLLTRTNERTGLRMLDDPAMAMVEICNESGFFLRPEALEAMPARQSAALQSLWIDWLRTRYRSDKALEAAWGVGALGEHEGLDACAIDLPILRTARTDRDDRRLRPHRYADGVRFLIDIQNRYLREMRGFLRDLGVRAPITGVLSNDHPADAASTPGLDFTAGNVYCDHPSFAGGGWTGPLHFSDTSPLREASRWRSGPALAGLRIGRRPAVAREWAQPWPNRRRAGGVAEIAAYGSLQDIDGLLLFGYHVAPRPDVLGDFDHQADPAVWGLYGPAALTYLRGDIRSAPVRVHLVYGPTPSDQPSDALRLAWHVGVTNVPSGSAARPDLKPAYPASSAPSSILKDLKRRALAGQSQTGATLVSSTGEIRRWTERGALSVVTPRTVILAGELGSKTWKLGSIDFRTRTSWGVLWAVSLDGLPLRTSRRRLFKMVSSARNTGQQVEKAPSGAPAPWRLIASGTPPVVTDGRAATRGSELFFRGRKLLSLNMVNGVWELLVERDRLTFWCDTGGMSGRLDGRRFETISGQSLVQPRTAP